MNNIKIIILIVISLFIYNFLQNIISDIYWNSLTNQEKFQYCLSKGLGYNPAYNTCMQRPARLRF